MEEPIQMSRSLVEIISKDVEVAEKPKVWKGVEVFFVAGIIFYLQVVSVVLFFATPEDVTAFVASPLVRASDIVSYLFYPVVLGAFVRLLIADPPQKEWAAAWAAALVINMVNGAWFCLAAPEDDRTFANFSTGVWACALCLSAATLWKLVTGMVVQASKRVSAKKLAVVAALATVVIIFWSASCLAADNEERAAVFQYGVKAFAATSCLIFLIWLWGVAKDFLMGDAMLAATSCLGVIIMCTAAGASLAESQEEKVACVWAAIFVFAVLSAVTLVARMARFVANMFVNPNQLAVLGCIVSVNVVFGAALSLSSTKEEKVAVLWSYLWTYALMSAAAFTFWLFRIVKAVFQDEQRIAAFALWLVINMVIAAAWALASVRSERMACLWVGVIALTACTVFAGVSWLVGLMDTVLEDADNPHHPSGKEVYEQFGRVVNAVDEGGHIRSRLRRASVNAGRRLSGLFQPLKDALNGPAAGLETMVTEGPARRVRRMSQSLNPSEDELAKAFSDFLRRG